MAATRKLQPRPCPFCGHKAAISHWPGVPRTWDVCCPSATCPVKPRMMESATSREIAVKLWNGPDPTTPRSS